VETRLSTSALQVYRLVVVAVAALSCFSSLWHLEGDVCKEYRHLNKKCLRQT
jgi:hypothetical protein